MPHAFSRTTRRVASALLLSSAVIAGASAQTVAVNPATTYQTVRGFGGFSGAGWAPELTTAQVDAAFGAGTGQIGLSVMLTGGVATAWIDPGSVNTFVSQ